MPRRPEGPIPSNKPIERLTAKEIDRAVTVLNRAVQRIEDGEEKPRRIGVGWIPGLTLNVRMRSYASGRAISASWILRRKSPTTGERRDYGLGMWPTVKLRQALERAAEYDERLWQGIDPKDEAEAALGQPKAHTFREAAERHFKDAVEERVNAKDEGKWFNDLERFVFPIVGGMPVDRIARTDIERIAEQPHVRYRRTDMVERRRAVMEDWAGHALSAVGTGLRKVG